MLNVAIEELDSGMVLAAPVAHPRTGEHTLLKAGFTLDAEVLAKLRNMGVASVWVQMPGLEFLDKYLGEAIPQSRAGTLRTIKTSFTKMSERIAIGVPVQEYVQSVNDLVFNLMAFPENAICLDRLERGGDELFSHSSNVSYLSMVVALQIRGYIRWQRKRLPAEHAQDVTNLGVGAMMHDLGKLSLAEEFHARHGIDREVLENDEYREHTEAGFKLAQWRVEPSAAQILLHHHQRFDGRGFPDTYCQRTRRRRPPLAGARIHIFSRVVAVANVLDALLSEDKQGPPVRALQRLQSSEFDGWFDPMVLRAFLKIIPPFPLGNVVTLTDGRRGAVIGLNGQHPCRPILRILDSVEPYDVNLAFHPEVSIQTHQGTNVVGCSYEVPAEPKGYAAICAST